MPFYRIFGVFVVGDDHFDEFVQGFFQICGVLVVIHKLVWY